MKRDQFSYTVNENGYKIQYLGVNLGGAYAKDNIESAEREIKEILQGRSRFMSMIGEIARKNNILPIYMEDTARVKPGLYLCLFHGFKSEKERRNSEGWGANGPMIGPLKECSGTYTSHLKLKFETDEDAKFYGFYMGKDAFNEIPYTKDGCLEFQRMEYGDFVVANFPKEE